VNLGLYAETYALWRDAGWFPSRVIILGVGHRSHDEFSCLPADYKTPLGEVEADHGFHAALASRCPFPLVRDARAFQGEHSIEFVVVWLQALRDLFFPERSFTILPVLCGGLQENVESGRPPAKADPAAVFAKALASLPGANDADTAWVASIDGCHVGPRFRHPFDADEKVRKLVASWEKHLWTLASSDTLPDFFQHLSSNSNGFYFDGVGVLHALLHGQKLKAEIQPTVQWHEPSDQSLVSFSRGLLIPSKSQASPFPSS